MSILFEPMRQIGYVVRGIEKASAKQLLQVWHGRPHRRAGRKPAPSEGRGPGIHVFATTTTARRGYQAFARYDVERQMRRSS
jgi:hypothetical protein